MNCTYIKYIIKLPNDLIQSIFIYLANIRISRKIQIYRQCIVLFSGNRWQIYFLLNLTKNLNGTGKKNKTTNSFFEPKKVYKWYRGHKFFSCLFFFFFALFLFFPPNFSFGFLPLDGSDGARATLRRLGQELIMNNKKVDRKEISDILILFTFLGDITYIASDSNRGKSL